MLTNLPSIIFWGVRVKAIDLEVCHTTLPFNWRTKNPFRSIYFAALCGGAELASGMLCMFHLAGEKRYSMLVVDFNAQFIKKANKKVTMKCEDGELIKQKLSGLSNSGDTAVVITTVMAHHPDNEVVAKFEITWSFKRK
jgi:acyl-coenzyme A thioesterase PaaI-like protein